MMLCASLLLIISYNCVLVVPEEVVPEEVVPHDIIDSSLQQIEAAIKQLLKQVTPIGYIYVQYPDQQKPEEMWPGTKWENVSAKYAGLFFRAEGGQSGSFETVQDSSYPEYYLDQYENHRTSKEAIDVCFDKQCAMPRNGWSDWIYTGGDGPTSIYNRHHVVSIDREVRPMNQAIRIWKRIQ